MKLLFDENLSPRLPAHLAPLYPGSSHVEDLGLRGQPDAVIWEQAREASFAIVTKDDDFRQRSIELGPPPRVIWLTVGNAGTGQIAEILRRDFARIAAFLETPGVGLLTLEP